MRYILHFINPCSLLISKKWKHKVKGSIMRRLNRKQTLKVVRELDAFAKVPEDYQEASAGGGTVALLTFSLIAVLVVSEVRFFLKSRMKYQYDVDADLNSKLQINADLTVAMHCAHLGADVVDISGDVAINYDNSMQTDPVYFAMSEEENEWHNTIRKIREAVAEEQAIQEVMLKAGYQGLTHDRPVPTKLEKPFDACRIHGSITVNKVAGNFHVTIGQNIPFNRGHAHISMIGKGVAQNFSHRIDHLSFGVPGTGVINPLDGDSKISNDSNMIYQYFLQVVPTKINTYRTKLNTYQYAVTEQERPIDHSAGSHGITGIFFKYELASLVISIDEYHDPYWQLLIRLCGIIGGVFATSGLFHLCLSSLYEIICCRLKKPKAPDDGGPVPVHQLPLTPAPSPPGITLPAPQ
ncbi:endoplasmic reticulum-Golgi intermediate compartment protein 2-like isoform X2 [Apostichopus japonicus]|uniref:endoplasmic reticulum-Golgi intermediate compartment protein 2-like isoform X2 n=1 Tax=Stichopus japonicus TaxID=307972 RepID=UPI003AB798CC